MGDIAYTTGIVVLIYVLLRFRIIDLAQQIDELRKRIDKETSE